MAAVRPLDVNLVLADVPDSPDELIALLAQRGAASAWVTRDAARGEGSLPGDALELLTAQTPELAHLPVICPPTGVKGSLQHVLALADGPHLRVLRVCPGAQRFPLASWVLSPLPEACADCGVALMIDFAPRPPDWAAILDLAREHPALPLIVTALDGSERFTLPALLDGAPNVIVDGGPLPAEQLTKWITLFGAHRFVMSCGGGGGRIPPDLTEVDRDILVATNAELLASGSWAERWL